MLLLEDSLLCSTVTIALFAMGLILFALERRKQEGQQFKRPPGPTPWPFIGNLLQMGEQLHICLTKLRDEYGDVLKVKMGSLVVVVLSGYDTIKQALVRQGESFAGRPDLFSFSAVANGTSMTFSEKYGEAWILHKKICKNALRTFSQAKANNSMCSCLLEERICAEASELVNALSEHPDRERGFDPTVSLVTSVANVVCALCFGKRYDYSDKEFLNIVQINNEVLRIFAAGNLADFFPIFRYLPSPSLRKMVEYIGRMNSFIEDNIQEHLNTFDKNCIRDITDALIAFCEDRYEEEKQSVLSKTQIVRTVIDIFGADVSAKDCNCYDPQGQYPYVLEEALLSGLSPDPRTCIAFNPPSIKGTGFDTIIAGLQWSLLYLIKFPDIQCKIYLEIDDKIGFNRLPRFEDKPKMPFTEAFIYEVFRHSSYVPFTIPHSTTENTVLNGYFIPKDTCIFINQYQVNHDPDLWSTPNAFQPERFLDASGQLNKDLTDKVMIFGMGKRRCVGDGFARLEMFLFFTTLLHRLQIANVSGQELDLTAEFGLTMKPKPYKISVSPRH